LNPFEKGFVAFPGPRPEPFFPAAVEKTAGDHSQEEDHKKGEPEFLVRQI